MLVFAILFTSLLLSAECNKQQMMARSVDDELASLFDAIAEDDLHHADMEIESAELEDNETLTNETETMTNETETMTNETETMTNETSVTNVTETTAIERAINLVMEVGEKIEEFLKSEKLAKVVRDLMAEIVAIKKKIVGVGKQIIESVKENFQILKTSCYFQSFFPSDEVTASSLLCKLIDAVGLDQEINEDESHLGYAKDTEVDSTMLESNETMTNETEPMTNETVPVIPVIPAIEKPETTAIERAIKVVMKIGEKIEEFLEGDKLAEVVEDIMEEIKGFKEKLVGIGKSVLESVKASYQMLKTTCYFQSLFPSEESGVTQMLCKLIDLVEE